MRIAFLHRDLPPDTWTGAAIQVHRLGNALVELGHHVDIFTFSKAPRDARYGVRPIQLKTPLRQFPALKRVPGLKRLLIPWSLREQAWGEYDIVHIHGDGGFLAYRDHWVRTFYGTAGLEKRHGQGFSSYYAQAISYALEKKEARRCRHGIGISAHIAEHLPNIAHILPCLTGQPSDSLSKTKASIPTFIHVGALDGRKRGSRALALWKKLAEAGVKTRLHLVCPPHQAERLRETSLSEDVRIHAAVSQEVLDSLYRESWFVLSLAAYEGFGVALIEGMAMGCLPLSLPHAGAVDLLQGEWGGFLSSEEDLPKKVTDIMDQGVDWSAWLSKLTQFTRRFAPETVARQYERVYQNAFRMRRHELE